MNSDDGHFYPPPVRELLDRPLVAHVSTVSPTGSPQASLVWFERRDRDIVFFTPANSAKARYLAQNPQVVVLIVDPERMLGAGTPAYVRLSGTADVRPAQDGIADHMARRYGHPTGYPWPLGDVLTVHVRVERISGLGPFATSKLGGWLPASSERGPAKLN